MKNAVLIEIPATSAEEWYATDCYCVYCGHKSVYVAPKGGNYHTNYALNSPHICITCDKSFTVQPALWQEDDDVTQRATLIRALQSEVTQ